MFKNMSPYCDWKLILSNIIVIALCVVIMAVPIIVLAACDVTIADKCPVEVNEPNEPCGDDYAGDIVWDVNDTISVYGDYFIECDPNLLIEFSSFCSDSVIYYLGNEQIAEFTIVRDGVVGCNISEAEFLEYLPQFLYNYMGKVDPNVQYVIEWNESKKERNPE